MKPILKIMMSLTLGAFLISHSSNAMGQLFLMKSSLEGNPAPDFRLLTSSGKEMSLSEAKGGNGAILFFWATWCPHCREQLGHLEKLSSDFEQKGIKVLLVDVGEGPGQVQAFIEKNKISFLVFLDQESKVSDQYELVGVPTFFLINKEGIVKSVVHSLPEDYEAILK